MRALGTEPNCTDSLRARPWNLTCQETWRFADVW